MVNARPYHHHNQPPTHSHPLAFIYLFGWNMRFILKNFLRAVNFAVAAYIRLYYIKNISSNLCYIGGRCEEINTQQNGRIE